MRGHPGPELVIQIAVVERVPVRVLGGEPGAVVEGIGAAPVLDRAGEGVLDRLPVSLGAPVQAELAPVDLRDPQPGRLEFAQPERRVRVHRQRELGRRDADAGHHLAPHVLDGVLAVRDVDVHASFLPSLPGTGRSGTSSAS